MNEDYVMIPGSGTKTIVRDVKQEIESAFLDYSMSVIVSRALPDVRDGLKPVHRRILYTMHERGNDPQHPYRKSADTVGAVLGAYHPHGDASVYDAMVRLAQDFSMRYPLVDGQGNFGSVDGDPPAAYRYTEARMSKMACELLTDIEKDTIDWDPNFDETKKEPHVLPSRFPNLLCNGSTGIAVGMATNIPPHNLCEVVDGCIALIDDPEIDLAGLMDYIKGPDFPTGGIIMGRSGIRAAYATGRGKITLRGRAEIEEKKNGRYQIVITEIPYMVNKARMIESIADLVKEKRIEGISDLNDESNRHGMRVVVELKKEANPQVVLNNLYRYTQLQDTVGVILLALDNGVPKIMTLKTMLQRYVEFQDQVIRRRTQFDLKKARERAHILEGLKRAVDIVDEVIYAIRHCGGGQAEAKVAIMEQFGFDDVQADAICKFPLGRLAGLEIKKIENELSDLSGKIADWTAILNDDSRVLAIVKNELTALKEKFGDDRRTEIAHVSGEVDIEDLIPEEECVFTLTHEGYIKRQPKDTYQVQRRGGLNAVSLYEGDALAWTHITSGEDELVLATHDGQAIRFAESDARSVGRTSHGVRAINLAEGDYVVGAGVAREGATVFTVTEGGKGRRSQLSDYRLQSRGGKGIRNYAQGGVAGVKILDDDDDVILISQEGILIRMHAADINVQSRYGSGVRVMRLAESDRVVTVARSERDEENAQAPIEQPDAAEPVTESDEE